MMINTLGPAHTNLTFLELLSRTNVHDTLFSLYKSNVDI